MSTGVPAALERSRSGNGAHVWVFFAAPVRGRLGASARCAPAARGDDATRASSTSPATTGSSRTRTSCPQKGFGNLIALPLQGRCRAAGTSVFLDPATLEPWPDQWAFLSSIDRLEPERLERSARRARGRPGRHGGARRQHEAAGGRDALPAEIRCTIGADLAIPKASPAAAAARRAQAPGLAAQPALLRASAAATLDPPDTAADPLLRGGPDASASAARPARSARRRPFGRPAAGS